MVHSPVSKIPIPNASLFDDSVLVGGQPSLDHLEQAAAAGYRVVVNLRTEGEFSEWDERAAAEALGLRYVAIPMAGAAGLTLENAERLAAELDRAENRPILLHCGSGNRVGALIALRAFHLEGLDPQKALQLGLDSGLTSLEPAVREYFSRQDTP